MGKFSISIEESTAIKGLLIILIIMGHAQPLIQIPNVIRRFVYDFHVQCFFILPLLYPVKQLTKERVKNYFARLMVPFYLLFVVFFFGKHAPLVLNSAFPDEGLINFIQKGGKGIITGGYFPLAESIGVRYLWFLPVMFSFSIVRDYYNANATKTGRCILMLIGAVSYFVLWVCLYTPFCAGVKETVMDYSPFSIWQAIGALFMGVMTIRIIGLTSKGFITNFLLPIVFFSFFCFYAFTPNTSPLIVILKAIIPCLAFMMVYNHRNMLSQSKILRMFGKHSFEIYIVQTPICIAMYTIIPKIISIEPAIIRTVLFFLVLATSYFIALLLLRVKIVKRFLFPRTWNEVRGKNLTCNVK